MYNRGSPSLDGHQQAHEEESPSKRETHQEHRENSGHETHWRASPGVGIIERHQEQNDVSSHKKSHQARSVTEDLEQHQITKGPETVTTEKDHGEHS